MPKPIGENMLVTTISSYYDDKIDRVLGLFSTTSETSLESISLGYNNALHKMKMATIKEGADAVIGIQLHIHQKDEKLSELLLIGTAVVLKDEYKSFHKKRKIIK